MKRAAIFARRRLALAERVGAPVLLVGNAHRVRNIPTNTLPFRQDSTFLFFTGCTTPGAAVLIEGERSTLFVERPGDDDPLWHGPVPSLEDQRRALGFDTVAPLADLEARCAPLRDSLLSLAVPDTDQTRLAARLTGLDLAYPSANGPDVLLDAVTDLRLRRDEFDLLEMRAAVQVTAEAHAAAMAVTAPGVRERQVAAVFDGVIAAHGMVNAYSSIVTVQGEILHNTNQTHTLDAGQLLLVDGAAESPFGLATDVTRTWPVSGAFDPRQRAAYDAVLAANVEGIARCRSGTRFRDVHLAAARVLTRWLVDEGLLRGPVDDLVARGAHALFFPHGLGHLIGYDVHDLEGYGDRALYAPGRERSEQFGLGYLRLDRDLEPGMVVTIEPGFYVVPAILARDDLVDPVRDAVDLERARAWMGFGGIRIEDDVLVTEGDPEVLTRTIPKDAEAVAAAVGTRPLPFWCHVQEPTSAASGWCRAGSEGLDWGS